MALSVGIFRHRSQRPFQRAIRKKFVVPAVSVAPDVPAPGWLEHIVKRTTEFQHLVFRPIPDVRWQLKRHQRRWVVPSVFVAPPPPPAPGYLEAIQNQRRQFHLRREPIDSIWRQRRPTIPGVFVAPPGFEPAYLQAVKSQRKQLGRRGRLPDQYWRQRKHLVYGVGVAPSPRDIGWMVSYIRKRDYGHNLRR